MIMRYKIGITLIVIVGLFVGALQRCQAEGLVAQFSNITDTKFSIQAISPREEIREFAICKAVWFAEKKKWTKMSLGDPVYSNFPRKLPGEGEIKVPEGWIALTTTAYLSDPNPSGNPSFTVAEKAAQCRKAWDWYR